jgi:molecular chaperone DnaK
VTSRIYGIDLGTTYSCISYVDESGRPVVLNNIEGDQTTPSVVFFEGPDNIVVGKAAKQASRAEEGRVVSFVKRNMGDPSYTFDVDGRPYTPEEVSSLILRKLVQDAEATTGEKITDVVITCPAYFGIAEREATKNAGVLAGLTVHRILDEPVAAAICYGVRESGTEETVLVYDLGGGTFDITVIRIEGGDVKVIYTGGDHNLGGKDWDERVINYLCEEFMKAEPAAGDPRNEPLFLSELFLQAEDLKRSLSAREKVKTGVSYGGARAQIEVTREKLEEITGDLMERTIELTQSVLKEAEARGTSKIDKLLLVGGSSRMPVVTRRLKEVLSLDPHLFEPDLSVAKGAALMALTIEAKEGATFTFPLPPIKNVKTTCSHGFGVVVAKNAAGTEEEVVYLIHENTTVPTEASQTFGTLNYNQTSVNVVVVESNQVESSRVEDNRQIAEGEITRLSSNLPQGSPIHVTFSLREDARLDIRAVEPSSGRELTLNVDIAGALSAEQVQQKRRDLLTKNVS